jgi:hypothetical protein
VARTRPKVIRRQSMEKKGSFLKRISLAVLLLLALFVPNGRAEWVSVDPPAVSAAWVLNGVHFPSAAEGWAVGTDTTGKKGVLLHWTNASWKLVTAPDAGSTDWGLNGVHFTSATEGWAVGTDNVGKKGVLLHYLKGIWTKVDLPATVNVSPDWGLNAVQFISATEGWAVGTDNDGTKGVFLQYLKGNWTKAVVGTVSNSWSVEGLRMISSSGGWAVGRDVYNNKGLVLQYTGSWAKVTLDSSIVNSSNWRLWDVGVQGKNVYAVGEDTAGGKGVILQYVNKTWSAATGIPAITDKWSVSGLFFLASGEGWFVGENGTQKTGLVLRYNGAWEVMDLPQSLDNWSLSASHFTSSMEGWAVGQTGQGTTSQEGVLLHYVIPEITPKPSQVSFKKVTLGANKELTVNVKNTGTGNLFNITIDPLDPPFYLDTDECTGQVIAPQESCRVIYRFSPSEVGDVEVTSRIYSNAPANNPALLYLQGTGLVGEVPTITVDEPEDGHSFSACSYFSLPTFTWALTGSVKTLEILFSTDSAFATVPVRIKAKTDATSYTPSTSVWKKVLLLGDAAVDGTVYWMMVGTLPDKTYVESETFSLTVDDAQAVANPQLSPVSQSEVPTLSWQNNCATKFTAWFSNDDGSKTKGLSFKVKNPLDNGGAFSTVLSESQWNAIRGVVKDTAGETINWTVESWDALKRTAETGEQQFILEP